MNGIKRFKVETKELSARERLLLEKLILAAKLIAPLYLKQKNDKYPGANFYPPDAAREEIEKAAGKNPAILSPYTFVERNKFGKLIAVSFHQKFEKKLKRISKILKETASLSQDKNLKAYLKSRAEDLLTDNYDKSNILWLKTEHSRIGCVIGPFDRYLDKLFFKKRAYMAWVGILDEKQTKSAEKFKSMILVSERKFLPGAKKAKIPSIKVRIEDTIIHSGMIADFVFVGNNLPSSADIYLIKKYGTLFTVFKPTMKLRFEKGIFPIFKAIFGESIRKNYSEKELYSAHVRSIILHEICHSLMRYEDTTVRLQELFPFFDELYTDILGIKGCALLLLKDALTQKELETLLVILICRHLFWLHLFDKNPIIISYATGAAISLNFLLKGKAIKKKRGFFIPDFQKLFICVDQLSHLLEYYISIGNHNEAKEFIKEYGSFRVFQEYFLPKLSKIPQKI